MLLNAVIFCLIQQLVLTDAQPLLTVCFVSTVPHLLKNTFDIQIKPQANGTKLSDDPSDTMVIRIYSFNFTEEEKSILNYGSQDAIDEEILGKFMDIKVWEKNFSSLRINISIMFKRGAHNKYLEIFYFSAPNKFQRRKYLKNLSLAKRLLYQKIELFMPSQLNLSMYPLNVDRKEIIINDMVMASCRAFGGIPQEKPKFEDHVHLNVMEKIYNKTTNEIRMNLRASLSDHLTNFSCSAGNVTETYTIRIHHHPTALYIQPIIKKRFRSNSTIICFTKDGYPDPEINWQLIEGPPNADRFYNFPGKGDQIHINSNSPVGSKWTFKCTMKSMLVNTKKMLNKTISFAIAKNPMEICGEKCLSSRISEIEESVEENGRLHEDIRLILNQTKEQMKIINKLNENIQMTNNSLKHLKEQIENQIKEQKDSKLNNIAQIKNLSEIQVEKYLKDLFEIGSFRYTFMKTTYEIQYSPMFRSMYPLFVQIWTEFSNYAKTTFSFGLKLKGSPSIHVDLNIQCKIFATKTPGLFRTPTFIINYRGESFGSKTQTFPSREIFGKDRDVDTRFSVQCKSIWH